MRMNVMIEEANLESKIDDKSVKDFTDLIMKTIEKSVRIIFKPKENNQEKKTLPEDEKKQPEDKSTQNTTEKSDIEDKTRKRKFTKNTEDNIKE